MTRLALTLAALLFAASAQAATVQSFVPGSAPCAGACTEGWAASEAGIDPAHLSGRPVPVVVPVGALITWMSYATNGVPRGGPASMVAAGDYTGVGYRLHDGSWFVRLDACMNWAIVYMPAPVVPAAAAPAYVAFAPKERGKRHRFGRGSLGGYGPSGGDGGKTVVYHEVSTPKPVPLPASLPLLLSAMAGLGFLKLYRKGKRQCGSYC